MNEPIVRVVVLPENIIPVCHFCRGSGIAGTPKTDKRDRPPVERCQQCHGSGQPPADHAQLA